MNAFRTPGNDWVVVYFGHFDRQWEKSWGRREEQEERARLA